MKHNKMCQCAECGKKISAHVYFMHGTLCPECYEQSSKSVDETELGSY